MPPKIYAAEIFKDNDLNDWRSRFIAMKDNHEILVLSDRKGLPNWLQRSGKNEWERGNQWVLHMGEASDAAKQTLVVLWDGKEQGAELGGTAHMVQLTRNMGSIDIRIIDANLLTNNQENMSTQETNASNQPELKDDAEEQLSEKNEAIKVNETFNKSEFKTERNQVFFSYSHREKKWLEDLKIVLAPLIDNQEILAWDDSKIKPGSEWRKEIENALNSAKVAVLMVSPHFLASKFIVENELPKLLEAAQEEGLIVLLVHIRDSLYKKTKIEIYQAAHDPEKPISSIPKAKRSKVLVEICEKIQEAFKS